MGYTHFFTGLQPDQRLADATAEIVAVADCIICDGMGEGEPVITEDEIYLNGNAVEGEDGETFYLRRGDYDTNFCKTGERPYDEAVTAILTYAILSGSEGSENIGTDGDIVRWRRGIELYEACFGRLGENEYATLVDVVGIPRIPNENHDYIDAPAEWFSSRDDYEDACERVIDIRGW